MTDSVIRPTREQQAAIQVQDRALVVEAGAGTGKTWVLVRRFLHLLESHPEWPLESIVAVTFTKKATREMRSRIRQAVEDAAQEAPADSHWRARRGELERLQVGTIHSLCARLLKENAIAAGIDPRFEVLDEQEAELIKEEAVRQALAELVEADHPSLELLSGLRVFDLREEMANLLAQRGTVGRLFAEMPDEGALLARWREGLAAMRQALWADLLAADPYLPVALAEIPLVPVASAQDKLAPYVEQAQEGCRLLAEEGDLPGAIACWIPIMLNVGSQGSWGGAEGIAELKAWLKSLREAAKALEKAGAGRSVGEDDREAAAALGWWRRLWDHLAAVYDRLKDERQALDFDDLERLAEALLYQDKRSGRLADYLDGMKHLMVDEFQDTNEIQGRIVYALAHPRDGGRLFVVGDAKQSIYRFRQAQVSVFNRTARDVAQITGHEPLPLSLSFRTHAGLITPLNHLFDRILRPVGHGYQDFEARPGPLEAQRPAPTGERTAPLAVELLLLPKKDETGQTVNAEDARLWEAQVLARRLSALQESDFQVWDRDEGVYRAFRYGDAAVLFRATTNLPLYEGEFKAAGLPYLTVSGRGYYDRPEVRDLIALLASLYSPDDDLNLATALRSPLFNLNDETLYRLRWHDPSGALLDKARPLYEALADPPPSDQVEQVAFTGRVMEEMWAMAGRADVWRLLREAVDKSGYEAALAMADLTANRVTGSREGGGRQVANLHKFLALARERGGASLSDFLRRLQDLQAREAREGEAVGAEPEQGSLQLMSIHAAKGLEFPVVAVADLGRKPGGGFGSPRILHDPAFGLVCKERDEKGDWAEPAGYAWAKWLNEQMESAESKRLLYVACTRAADLLLLSGKVGGRGSWLSDILAAWEIEPEGEPDEIDRGNGFPIRVRRPAERPALVEPPPKPESGWPGLVKMPQLAQPLPGPLASPPEAVTRLIGRLAREEEDLLEVRPAVRRSSLDDAEPRAPGWLVGQVLHRALAEWGCLAQTGRELEAQLKALARREGVLEDDLEAVVEQALRPLERLRLSTLYRKIDAAGERYSEVPFSLETASGVLYGVIDLLYRDGQGQWHVLDWKSEWLASKQRAEQIAGHLPQMAVYAEAVRRIVGVEPVVSLCFLRPQIELHTFTPGELSAALEELQDSP